MGTLKVPVGPADHIQGDENAACTLVEYGDYQCPHCGRAYPIVKRVQKHFGERLRFVFRNFPLSVQVDEKMKPVPGSEFELYAELAQQLKLAPADPSAALQKKEYLSKVRSDFSGGVRSGVNGTPTFFINGQRHDAPVEYGDLVAAIEAALSAK